VANWATVTVTDKHGVRHSIDVKAESTYDAAHSVGFRPTFEALLQNTYGLSRLAVVDEFRCVMQNQDRTIRHSHSIASRLEMS
jgi:hypothetical protein